MTLKGRDYMRATHVKTARKISATKTSFLILGNRHETTVTIEEKEESELSELI